jgi:hypothetical protein
MPVKKKKTTKKKKPATKAKKAPKKKVSKSSVAKKKTAKKVTKKKVTKKKVKRKTSTKKPKKKKIAKKKTVKKTETQVAVHKHASELHSVTTKHVDLSVKDPKKAVSFDQGFSFPSALSQVRNVVSETQIQDTTPITKSRSIKKQVETSDFVSPYVLDLRKQKTLLHGVKPSQKEQTKPEKQEQSVLSLFESPKKQKSLAESFKDFSSFGQQFKTTKSTNFAPIAHKFQPGSEIKRLHRSLMWRMKYHLGLLKRPFERAKSKKLQKTIEMPRHLGKQTPSWLTEQTRSGKPISVSVLSRVKKEQKVAIRHESDQPVKKEQVAKKTRTFSLPQLSFDPNAGWQKTAMSFAGLCLLFVLPFGSFSVYKQLQQAQGEVFGATNLALQDLEQAQLHATQLDFITASEHFSQAGQAFQAAAAVMDNRLGVASSLVASVPVVGEKVKTGKLLLQAGENLSESAALLTQAVDVLTNDQHFLSEEELSFKLEFLFVRIAESAPLLTSSSETLAQVNLSVLPEEFQDKVSVLQKTMPLISEQFSRLASLEQAILPFIGHDSLQRYLVVFQNNTELRATGGFFGSLALVDLDRGEIQDIEVPGGGPYDYQGSLFENYQAPRALQLLTPRWELQDANWYYDWPTSAQNIANLYEKAGGPSVDGVVAIDTQVLQGLLELVGPVELPAYDVVIDTENFRSLLQEEVEFDYDKELNQPKKIIGDLVPVVLERVKELEPKEYIALGQTFASLLEQKDILIHHGDEEVQTVFADLGWSGEVVETEADYLAIVHTNLAGGKTDGVIDDEYKLDVHIDADGEVTNTLTIRRTHNGTRGTPLTGVRNVNYMRVFVPQGSELISATASNLPPQELFEAPEEDWMVQEELLSYQKNYRIDEESGVEIFEEAGKTVFGQWVQLDPQEVVEVKLTYKVAKAVVTYEIPEREESWTDWVTGKTAHTNDSVKLYHLYWQKQSGAWSPSLDITVNYPQQWQAHSDSTVEGTFGAGNWQTKAKQTGDSIWSLLMY